MEIKNTRIVAGLMSGTSLDGVDAALARLTGSGKDQEIELLDFVSIPYQDSLRALLLKNSQPASSSVLEIAQLNVRLAHVYAEAIASLLTQAHLETSELDAVGCHGQTIYHVPDAELCAGQLTRSTLQIGDPSTLANLLSTTVVGDFRLADMALGGQGAPLVPYFDYVYFSHPHENRVLLNIGGIGNLSVLPAGGVSDKVMAFDTGPGNMISDAVVQHFWDQPYDEGGELASRGSVHAELLHFLLDDPYYDRVPPKSTGREFYNQEFVDRLLEKASSLQVARPEDIVATVAMFTVKTIARAYKDFVEPNTDVQRIIASGGGVHNAFIMKELQASLPAVKVESMQDFGLNPDAKEALCFAVLAHETLNGVASNVPSATGAARPAILGKICLPG